MAMKEKESAESGRRWKEVDHLLEELHFEKGENRKLLGELKERSRHCKYLERCLLKERGREEVLTEKVKEMKTAM